MYYQGPSWKVDRLVDSDGTQFIYNYGKVLYSGVQKRSSQRVVDLLNVSCLLLYAALCCIGASIDCVAICPNQDLAGIGVRIAFYLQSFMNALLVIFSPTDSVPTTWAGTLLTAALIVAAIVMKAQSNLTLYHATLILNFATLSCISSLAVAPMLPIWRLTPSEYFERERARHALTRPDDDAFNRQENLLACSVYINAHKKQLKDAQTRARVVLSLAILLQVVLQWAWGIFLFVSPVYSQPECSGSTVLIIFLRPFTVGTINNLDGGTMGFLIWPAWLLFSLAITLGLTVNLALTSPHRARPEFSGSSAAAGTGLSSATPVVIALGRMALQSLPTMKTGSRRVLFWSNFLAALMWALFIASSEWQRMANCVFSGEDSFGGFGQITAIFVAVAPLWSLSVALYKYPALRRREERRQRRGGEELPKSCTERFSMPRQLPGYGPVPSDDTSHPIETHEMQILQGRRSSNDAVLPSLLYNDINHAPPFPTPSLYPPPSLPTDTSTFARITARKPKRSNRAVPIMSQSDLERVNWMDRSFPVHSS